MGVAVGDITCLPTLSFISCFSFSLSFPITTFCCPSKILHDLTFYRNHCLKWYNNISNVQFFTSIDFNPQAPNFHILSWQELGIPKEGAGSGYWFFCMFFIQVLSNIGTSWLLAGEVVVLVMGAKGKVFKPNVSSCVQNYQTIAP